MILYTRYIKYTRRVLLAESQIRCRGCQSEIFMPIESTGASSKPSSNHGLIEMIANHSVILLLVLNEIYCNIICWFNCQLTQLEEEIYLNLGQEMSLNYLFQIFSLSMASEFLCCVWGKFALQCNHFWVPSFWEVLS